MSLHRPDLSSLSGRSAVQLAWLLGALAAAETHAAPVANGRRRPRALESVDALECCADEMQEPWPTQSQYIRWHAVSPTGLASPGVDAVLASLGPGWTNALTWLLAARIVGDTETTWAIGFGERATADSRHDGPAAAGRGAVVHGR